MATFDEIRALKKRHSAALLRKPGVCGVDIESTPSGEAVLTVHLDTNDDAVRKGLPDQIDGHAVRYVHTGPYEKQ